MTHIGAIETNCECRYSLTVTDQILDDKLSETKDNFNHVQSIHEIDEDETDEEDKRDEDTKDTKDTNLQKDTVDNDTTYTEESFCSDESYDESEATDVISHSFVGSSSSSRAMDYKSGDSEALKNENSRLESQRTIEDGESLRSSCGRRLMSDQRSVFWKPTRGRRRNMSFTDEEMRRIERENQLLLRKIMAQQKPREKILRNGAPQCRTSSSAVNRKKLQRKIEYDNMLLLQRIQQTKPCVMNTSTKPGCRVTFL